MFENFRLNMLNREAASPKNKPEEIVKSLDIKDGSIIADIGSGGGYFTLKFAKEAGEKGKVYAVDTNQKSLDYIADKFKKEGLNNIEIVLAEEKALSLPEKVDLIFLRNVFHHLPEQTEYFENIKQHLKSEGKIAIIDYNKRGFSFTGVFGHYTPVDVLIEKMEKAGFHVLEKYDFLPDQLFIIFKMKN